MEESGEMHSEENKALQDNYKKRKLKTPFQVQALEEFYTEHKYPTESMKKELAEKIGLSEKQVSGWFCHRRLKDKRILQEDTLGNGKQDRSSSVIQDRGSGLRQDSCGSTKQGDYRLPDPREVDSQSLYREDLPEESYRHRLYASELSITDDSSSETSSPSQDRFLPPYEDPCDVEAKNYQTQYGSGFSLNAYGVKARKNVGASGYLKVKGDAKNAAIVSVKRQLGRHYREDGPPLGVEFQPLPPGAFDSQDLDDANDPYHSGNRILPNSSNIAEVQKKPKPSKRYEGHPPMITSLDSYTEGKDLKSMGQRDHLDNYPSRHSKQNSSLPDYRHASASQTYGADRDKDLIREVHSYSRKFRMMPEGMRLDSTFDHNEKLDPGEADPWLNHDNRNFKVLQRQEFLDCKPTNVAVRHQKLLDTGKRKRPRIMSKEDNFYDKRGAMKECGDLVDVKLHATSDLLHMKVGKRMKRDSHLLEVLADASAMDMPPRRKPIKGAATDMPSSFSEDETAETSSSMD